MHLTMPRSYPARLTKLLMSYISLDRDLDELDIFSVSWSSLGVVRALTSQWGFTRPSSIYFSLGLMRMLFHLSYTASCHFSMLFNESLNNRASWTEGRQTEGRTDGQTDSPCVLQDFISFGAAALLPLNLNHILLKQGTGTADHLLPLGCYFWLGRRPGGGGVKLILLR